MYYNLFIQLYNCKIRPLLVPNLDTYRVRQTNGANTWQGGNKKIYRKRGSVESFLGVDVLIGLTFFSSFAWSSSFLQARWEEDRTWPSPPPPPPPSLPTPPSSSSSSSSSHAISYSHFFLAMRCSLIPLLPQTCLSFVFFFILFLLLLLLQVGSISCIFSFFFFSLSYPFLPSFIFYSCISFFPSFLPLLTTN